MAKSENQKQKLLAVRALLLEKSDENNLLTSDDIIEALRRQGIEAERKSIYSDIAALQQAGMDIEQRRGARGGYFVANRDFELPELKLLVDAVRFCRFITPQKSEKLTRKLSALCSSAQARELQARHWAENAAKSDNESILANIDTLNTAVNNHTAVSFKYYKWGIVPGQSGFTQLPTNEGRPYTVLPLGLIWGNENYYLVARGQAGGEIRHYRLDRMKELRCLEERFREDDFDLGAYAVSHFNMMGGAETRVRLRVHNDLAAVLADKYGAQNIMPIPDGAEHFECSVQVSVSEQFYGWLLGLGDKIELLAPRELREEYAARLRALAAQYGEVE